VFLVLLCNDRAVLGPWVNKPWLNIVATLIVSVLLMLSLILVITTLAPNLDARLLVAVLGSFDAIAVVVASVWMLVSARQAPPEPEMSRADKESWRMPALALLQRPAWSAGRKFGMMAMRGYLVIAVILLIVKAIELAIHRT
jgi:hypothetical protein